MGPHLADQEGVVGTKPPGQGLAEGGELGPQLAAPAPRAPPGRLCRGRAPRALPGPTPQDVVGDGGQLDAGDAHAGHHAVPMHIQPPAPLDQPLPAHPSSGRVAGAGRSFVCTILLVGLVAPLRGSEKLPRQFQSGLAVPKTDGVCQTRARGQDSRSTCCGWAPAHDYFSRVHSDALKTAATRHYVRSDQPELHFRAGFRINPCPPDRVWAKDRARTPAARRSLRSAYRR